MRDKGKGIWESSASEGSQIKKTAGQGVDEGSAPRIITKRAEKLMGGAPSASPRFEENIWNLN